MEAKSETAAVCRRGLPREEAQKASAAKTFGPFCGHVKSSQVKSVQNGYLYVSCCESLNKRPQIQNFKYVTNLVMLSVTMRESLARVS